MRTIMALAFVFAMNSATADVYDSIALTAFDYMEGWYSGDAAQMERALHPDLVKRRPHTDADGRKRLHNMGALRLVQLVRSGGGTGTPEANRMKEVVILDVHGDVASVKVIMHGWIDYLHMARLDGQWLIVNVLWDLREAD